MEIAATDQRETGDGPECDGDESDEEDQVHPGDEGDVAVASDASKSVRRLRRGGDVPRQRGGQLHHRRHVGRERGVPLPVTALGAGKAPFTGP